eukprot:864719-Prymnesium_polylepis.1
MASAAAPAGAGAAGTTAGAAAAGTARRRALSDDAGKKLGTIRSMPAAWLSRSNRFIFCPRWWWREKAVRVRAARGWQR